MIIGFISMKKQSKTYILLAVVLGIWGLIGFKFFSAVNPASPEILAIVSNKIFVPKQIKERDTFSISANYRDPFLGAIQVVKKKLKKRTNTAAKKEVLPTKLIQYTGFITASNSNQKIFFVSVDGEQQMMSINDTFQEVKLVRGTKNSIGVRYNGKTQNVPRTE